MRRISHDLPGIAQRISKLRDELSQVAVQTQQTWQDDRGRQFFQQHISEVSPTLNGLLTSLAQAIGQFEDIAKRVQDPAANS